MKHDDVPWFCASPAPGIPPGIPWDFLGSPGSKVPIPGGETAVVLSGSKCWGQLGGRVPTVPICWAVGAGQLGSEKEQLMEDNMKSEDKSDKWEWKNGWNGHENHEKSHWITLRDDLGRCRVAITRFDMEILGVLRNRALWKWFLNDQHQTLGISAYFDIFRIYILHSCDKTLPALFLLVTSHNLSIFESYPSDWLVTSLVSMVSLQQPKVAMVNAHFLIHIVDYLGKKTH